ncbi:TonB-dependent receptor [Pseudoduganella sp. FT26W]|uniref:TonB-dependent receptor n=1 Tax=Duganella aquatilis TaxID=2666082 RepID=A0A844D8L0_9BURK|nr:TonB-dependent receptor [Duganella aquatilis]MRW84516.1 TonB-dependent receptor [Duganella aquatilis]
MTTSNLFRLRPVAAACALLLGAAGASHAQQTDDTTTPAAVKPAEGELATVTVAGIRRGIEEAISMKKNSSSIVEAISAEDIGKLPDNTVAESISRLSGVTTQRNKTNGKATDVSVRGLSPSFNGALLNGREQASTSDARSPEFDLFPSELTGSVLVYKTPDASLMGQGLASTIDLRTLRPLDFGQRVLAASVRKERIGFDSGSDLGSGHRTTFSYVDQFANRTIGLSLGLTKFKEDNGGELKFDSWGGGTTDMAYNGGTAKVPSGFLAETSRRKSDRDGAALTLQYKPNQKFRSTLDVFYSRGDETTKKTGIEGAVAGSTGLYDPNGVLSNAVVANGIATSGTVSNYKADVRNHLYGAKDRLMSIGWNNELKLDEQWKLEADLSHSHGVKNISNYETTAGQPGNTPASQLGSVSYTGFNGTNFSDVKYTPSLNYADRKVAVLTDVDGWGGGPNSPQAGYVALPTIDDTVNAVRITAHRELDWGPIANAHFGANFTKRDKSRTGQEGRLSVKGGDGYASAAMPGTGSEMAGASGIMVASFDPTGTLGTIYDINRWVDSTVLARDWTVGEKVATVYAMADLDGNVGSLPYSGNFGLQVVHTRQEATGNQVDLANCTGITVETCPYKVRSDGTSYTNVLPSLNIAFDLGYEQKLRLGAGKQISRANLDNMKAGMDFSVQNSTSLAPALTGFAGNPQLKPYQARSLDLSYEKYFGKKGYISAAAFYKKLDNYIINAPMQFDFKPYTSATTPLPTTGPYAGSTIGFLTMPQNGNGGNMHGYELALNLPFALATQWLDGFGIAANYSFTDSSVRLPTSGFVSPSNAPVFNGAVSEIGLPGLSKNVSSVRVYYENHGLQLAWAAHRRSSFVGQILDYRSDSQFTFIKGETIVDLQASYEFQQGWLKGASVFLQGHNWTNTPFQEYTSDPNQITNKVVYGRTYTFGLNYKF